MDGKTPINGNIQTDKISNTRNEEYINVFKYFEYANERNRDAFCELLDYTAENYKDPDK